MITKFTNALKKSGKLSLAATIIFFAGVLISTYLLFTLPHNLTIRGGLPTLELAWPILIKLFVAVSLTFAAGILTINFAVRSQREIVVYLEKKTEDELAAQREEGANHEIKGIASFRSAIQGKSDQEALQAGLNALCQQLQAGQGAIYQSKTKDGKRVVELVYGFALPIGESSSIRFEEGEGLIGQAAASGTTLYLDEIPQGYITIVSGLGTASPRYLMIVPIRKEKEVMGVMEIATFSPLPDAQRKQVEECANLLAENITNELKEASHV